MLGPYLNELSEAKSPLVPLWRLEQLARSNLIDVRGSVGENPGAGLNSLLCWHKTQSRTSAGGRLRTPTARQGPSHSLHGTPTALLGKWWPIIPTPLRRRWRPSVLLLIGGCEKR